MTAKKVPKRSIKSVDYGRPILRPVQAFSGDCRYTGPAEVDLCNAGPTLAAVRAQKCPGISAGASIGNGFLGDRFRSADRDHVRRRIRVHDAIKGHGPIRHRGATFFGVLEFIIDASDTA